MTDGSAIRISAARFACASRIVASASIICTVSALDVVGHDVLVGLRVGDATLRARLTPAAVRELGLTEGTDAVAVVKTASIHLLG